MIIITPDFISPSALASIKFRKADIIFVMQDGAAAESGAHDELLTREGLYAHLYEIQFSNKSAAGAGYS